MAIVRGGLVAFGCPANGQALSCAARSSYGLVLRGVPAHELVLVTLPNSFNGRDNNLVIVGRLPQREKRNYRSGSPRQGREVP